MDSCRALEAEGFKVTYLPVQTNGIISMDQLEEAITPSTSLVSIMSVNNEIGVKQPMAKIGRGNTIYLNILKSSLPYNYGCLIGGTVLYR